MKFLGIDYGTKRIGLAVSDENSRLAFPKKIVFNNAKIFQSISEILKKENIQEIVVGESAAFSGKPNPLSKRIEIFILNLSKKFSLPVHKQKEFLTSVEARRSPNGKRASRLSQAHSKVKVVRGGRADARAAALILQRFLDKQNK